jgi:hypothetical protein
MDDEAVVDLKGLREDFGIVDSRSTISRKMKAGTFPAICNPGKHRNTHPLWKRRLIREYLQNPR